MSIMRHFTLRSMKANRTWTIVTLVGIIISTAMISAVSTFCESLIAFLRNDAIANTGLWHAIVEDVPIRDVKVFEKAGLVDEVFLSREMGYSSLEGFQNENKPYLFILEPEQKGYEKLSFELIQGRMPQNEGEIALPEHLYTNGGIKHDIGEALVLSVGNRVDSQGSILDKSNPYIKGTVNGLPQENLVEEKTYTCTVTGIIKRPNNFVEPYSSPGYTAIGFLNPDNLCQDDQVTVSLLVKKANRNIFHDVTELAGSIGLPGSKVTFNTELLHYLGVFGSNGVHNTVYGFASVITVLIVVASVSLIYNAFAISVSERIGQMGMLASVGATRQQKLASVYFEAFILGVVGIPLGILAGILGIGVTLSAIRPLTDSFLSTTFSGGLLLHVSLPAIFVACAVATLTIVISAWIPAKQASKTMPVDAIRQLKEVKLTSKTVNTSWLTRKLFGVEGEIALKNLKRSRKKYRATVLSLTISLVLFLTVSYFTQEMSRGFSTVETGQNFDLCVMYLNTPRTVTTEINAKIRILEEVTGATAVEKAEGFFTVGKDQLSPLALEHFFLGENTDSLSLGTSIYCLDDESFNTYARNLGVRPEEYADPQNPKMILVNFGRAILNGKYTAGEILSANPSEVLEFTSTPPGEGGAEANIQKVVMSIGALTDTRPMGILVESIGQLSAVVSRTVFDSLPERARSVDSGDNPSFQQLFLTTNDAASLEAKIFKLAADSSIGIHVFNAADTAQKGRNLAAVVNVFVYGFIVLMSLICVANTLNTVTTNVRLRRREMAMLRSVGMTPKSFNHMMSFESLFYGFKALLYGVPVSVLISLALYKASSEAFEFGFSLPWVSYGAATLLVFAIVGASMFYSIAKTKEENIVDALKKVSF